ALANGDDRQPTDRAETLLDLVSVMTDARRIRRTSGAAIYLIEPITCAGVVVIVDRPSVTWAAGALAWVRRIGSAAGRGVSGGGTVRGTVPGLPSPRDAGSHVSRPPLTPLPGGTGARRRHDLFASARPTPPPPDATVDGGRK